MSDTGLDERYVGYREHAAIAERLARVEAEQRALMLLPAQVAELTALVRALSERLERPAPGADAMTNTALAIHRLAETMARPPERSHLQIPPYAWIGLAAVVVVGLLVIGDLLGFKGVLAQAQ